MANTDNSATYPNHQIDPRDKGYDWILQYTKAAYRDGRGYNPYLNPNTGTWKMPEIKLFAMGKQPIDEYKKMLSPGQPLDQSWRAIDWTPPGFLCKFREIGIAKLLQRQFDIRAFAIDPIAKSEEDEFFNKMKAKIFMKEAAEDFGSPIADHPFLQSQNNEPQDMEELEILKEFGYKHAMGIEAENAINLIFYRNKIEELRKQVATSLYDYGIGALTQFLDENGMVKVRPINMEYFGCSYFEKPDGSDLIHWFEIVPTFIADLAPYYTKEQLDDICRKSVNKFGNPNTYFPVNGFFNQAWNRFKVMVLQIKFLSWNESVYKEEKDKRGNIRFGKSSYQNKQFLSVNSKGNLQENQESYEENLPPEINSDNKGQSYPKYINNVTKVAYKASWIVDTDYMHNYGLQENQNRKLSSWWETDLDIQIYAWNSYKMQFSGMTERLIPFENKACMTWFNLQNLANKLIPYLINIDFNSVEAVNFGKSGEKAKPSEIIDFIFSNFVVPYRSTDLLSRNPNYKPVSIEATGQLAAFSQLYEELQHTLSMMQQVSGLNEYTDASTPNPKTLVPGIQSAVQSTNNALYLISEAEKNILLNTADAIIQKVQIAVKLGKVEGYAKALGESTVKFFNIDPRIALHELGIFLEDAPTDEERQALWNDITMKESQGLLTPGDKYFIMSCRNLGEATQILDYKIEKRKQQQQQFELQKSQVSAQTNSQMAQVQEQMKQQTIQAQLQADLTKIEAEMRWQYEIEKLKKTMDVQGETVQADARTLGHQIQAEAKKEAAKIMSEGAKEKQHIANRKPQSVPSGT